jgi:hypothetical protein
MGEVYLTAEALLERRVGAEAGFLRNSPETRSWGNPRRRPAGIVSYPWPKYISQPNPNSATIKQAKV